MAKECIKCGVSYSRDDRTLCPECGKPLTPKSEEEPHTALTPAMQAAVRKECKNTVLGWLGLMSILALITWCLILYGGSIAARNQLKQQISTRLDAEFNEPNLKATVREAAEMRATAIIKEQVAPAITQFREDVNNFTARATAESERLESEFTRLAAKIAQILQGHSTILQKLTLLNNYTQTTINAEAGYRKAYDQLRSWAEDKSFPLTDQALQTWKKITSSHNPIPYRSNWPASIWFGDGDPSTLNLPELVAYYRQQAPLNFRKVAVIDYIHDRKDVPKADKMQFFIEVIEKDDSLNAVEYAGRYFGSLAGLKLHPLAVDGYLKWWSENRATLDDPP